MAKKREEREEEKVFEKFNFDRTDSFLSEISITLNQHEPFQSLKLFFHLQNSQPSLTIYLTKI